jgi:hypothetical protein
MLASGLERILGVRAGMRDGNALAVSVQPVKCQVVDRCCDLQALGLTAVWAKEDVLQMSQI